MVLVAGKAPFKHTLHAPAGEVRQTLSLPSFIRIACAAEAAGAHTLARPLLQSCTLTVPRLRGVHGVQVSSVVFHSAEEARESAQREKGADAPSRDPGVTCTLFMQLLDSHSRPSSAAIALVTGCTNISHSVKIALQPASQVRFYLVLHASSLSEDEGPKGPPCSPMPSSVTLTCQTYLMNPMGLLRASSAAHKKVHEWAAEKREFVLERPGGAASPGATSPPPKAAHRRDRSFNRGESEEGQPPRLIHAYVPGGDNES